MSTKILDKICYRFIQISAKAYLKYYNAMLGIFFIRWFLRFVYNHLKLSQFFIDRKGIRMNMIFSAYREDESMIENLIEVDDSNTQINRKLRQYFDGKIVRKDLTKMIKEGANVPIYVLEYLLGMYCSTDDENLIVEGVDNVKKILADNFVRPDEAQKIISLLRERGSYTIIDRITVKLNYKADQYEAEFSNLGIKGVPIGANYAKDYDRLLCGGIWCIVQLEYYYDEEDRRGIPFIVHKLTPIQMPHIDMEEIKEGRKYFSKDEWIKILLRSTGMEPDKLSERERWLHLLRMVPLVENNFNFCELGPRSTGKSHIYKEISPNSILVSGGQTTVANLFYNMSNKTVGLVGLWDCVAFDEVAGITFKDKDGVQIMKDYMASSSFARGKGCVCIHGFCRKYKSKYRCTVENISFNK